MDCIYNPSGGYQWRQQPCVELDLPVTARWHCVTYNPTTNFNKWRLYVFVSLMTSESQNGLQLPNTDNLENIFAFKVVIILICYFPTWPIFSCWSQMTNKIDYYLLFGVNRCCLTHAYQLSFDRWKWSLGCRQQTAMTSEEQRNHFQGVQQESKFQTVVRNYFQYVRR